MTDREESGAADVQPSLEYVEKLERIIVSAGPRVSFRIRCLKCGGPVQQRTAGSSYPCMLFYCLDPECSHVQ
jgi:hypothetical protein